MANAGLVARGAHRRGSETSNVRQLRVAVDAAPARRDPTGVGVYVRDLARALVKLEPESVALIGVRPDGPLAATAQAAAHRTWLAGGRHHRWLLHRARRDADEVGGTLVHFTNAAAPLRRMHPYVLTIQDLSLFRHPEHHPSLRLAVAPFTAVAAKRADAIIVPSEATRAELRRVLGIAGRRVVVVPHAASDPDESPPDGAGDRAEARRALGLGEDPYVLSVGTLEPRKNQARLVGAFDRLADRHPSLRLVLVGGEGWRGEALRHALRESSRRDRIHLAGYVPAVRLAALMSGAAVFAYVSLYEGFGLPILDAMRAGIPVVTSAVSSMPEVAGGAAILVDPRDPEAIADGIARALACPAELIRAGHARACGRTWADVAGETWEVYRWAALARDRL
ncbi:MAG TPA: glycosyltransferase family 1 protein [Candidatus Limnocylindrales bacterium]|jgi:alpha-1,3-rhamnosyl/mannosyltransferase